MKVFGYGSLVNRRTQSFGGEATTLAGWQRVWVTTKVRPAAYLSVMPGDGSIEGLAFHVPVADRADLDKREAQYVKLSEGDMTIYSVPEDSFAEGQAPILQSYLDVVLQGFLAEFGEAGLEDFMATTHGWERGIRDDRAAPIYPRAQTLTSDERAMFDALLASVPVVEKL